MFLSTPPSRVATQRAGKRSIYRTRFYPRHPRGWRRYEVRDIHAGLGVSIHATLAGGDVGVYYYTYAQDVSIHATLAGGDKDVDVGIERAGWFLSTPPSRVATYRF